jgi:hypothetical protein
MEDGKYELPEIEPGITAAHSRLVWDILDVRIAEVDRVKVIVLGVVIGVDAEEFVPNSPSATRHGCELLLSQANKVDATRGTHEAADSSTIGNHAANLARDGLIRSGVFLSLVSEITPAP